MKPGRPLTVAAALTIALCAGLLAGCTGSSSGSGPTGSTSASASSSSSGPSPSTSAIKNDPTARKDVTPGACVATTSGWKSSGTVTNPRAKDTTYTIVISFTTKAFTVLARGTTKVTVKPGATKKWSAQASFARTKGVQCVLRGVSEG